MIFASGTPQILGESAYALIQRMENDYAETSTSNQAQWYEADLDARYMAGDQSIWQEIYGNWGGFNQKQFNFNRIARAVNMVDGYQRQHRKSIIVSPRESSDQQTADQLTKIISWAMDGCNGYETISSAFRGSLIAGMNLVQVWMDYRTDVLNGVPKLSNVAYNEFLIDPFFKQLDLSDCSFIWKRNFFNQRTLISLLPDHTEFLMNLTPVVNNGSRPGRDGKFPLTPQSYNYGVTNLYTYDEYYYRTYRQQKAIFDPQSGRSLEWRGSESELKDYMALFPQIKVLDQEIPTVNVGIVVEGSVMYEGPLPTGLDRYPFVPMVCYYYPELPYYQYRVQGMVRSLRDSQFLYNRRKTIELDILESQANSGYIYKENALINPADVFLTGQGRGIALKEDAQMTDVQKIQAPDIPPSMMELSNSLANEIMQISGVNEELLGAAVDDKAGILARLRQGAGLTTLQIIFDQLDNSLKEIGKILIHLVQTNFTPGKVARIIEEEPAREFYDKDFGTYDAAVEEGYDTATQRQMQFAQMLQLREVGVPIPDEALLEAATMQNKNKVMEQIQQAQQQAQQMQAQQNQVQMQQMQAETELLRSRSIADRGLGLERVSRVEENKALAEERRAEAIKDDAQAILNVAKVVKELEGIDLQNIEKFIQLVEQIRAQQQATMQPEAMVPEETMGQPPMEEPHMGPETPPMAPVTDQPAPM